MGCDAITYTGLSKLDCKDTLAGVKSLFYREFGSGTAFVEFPLPIDLGDATEEMVSDAKLGISYVDITINGTLIGLTDDSVTELNLLLKSRQEIYVELYNGKFILYGDFDGLDVTAGGSRTGTEAASLQGYEVTWTGRAKALAAVLDVAPSAT